jgi:hypothetical protein
MEKKVAFSISSQTLNIIFMLLGMIVCSVIFIYLIKSGVFNANEALEVVKTIPLPNPPKSSSSGLMRDEVLNIIKETKPSLTKEIGFVSGVSTGTTLVIIGVCWVIWYWTN